MNNITLKKKTTLNKVLTTLFSPNQKMPRHWMWILNAFYITSFVILWEFAFPVIIPRISEIFQGLWVLVSQQGLVFELGSTLKLTMKAMLFSVPIAGLISFAGHTVNFARPLAQAMPSLRFWTTIGFSSIIKLMVGGGEVFQVYVLMFGIIPFMATGFNAVFHGVEKDRLYDYARTMGYSEWRCVWYVVVRNRLGKIYFAIRDNFAIAWLMTPAVEIASRDNGGLGAMLFDEARWAKGVHPFAGALAVQMVFLLCGIVLDRLFRQLVLTLREERVRVKATKS